VTVIDGTSHAVAATIPVGQAPVVALNQTTGAVYVANSGDKTISVIDGNTNAVVTTIPVGSGPAGLFINEATNKVYVGNSGDGAQAVIDGAPNPFRVTTDGVLPYYLDTVTNKIYGSTAGGTSTAVIDGATNSIVATFTLPSGGLLPTSGINATSNRAYFVDAN